MAQDGEPPKSADKGKGKAVEDDTAKPNDVVKKDADGKPLTNGRDEAPVVGGMRHISKRCLRCTNIGHSRRA